MEFDQTSQDSGVVEVSKFNKKKKTKQFPLEALDII